VLDRELVGLAAADARCRFVRARLVERLMTTRGWRALGFVRLGDFARERLGMSPRTLEDDAHSIRALDKLPLLGAALESGALSWTRLRLLLRTATPANERDLLDASALVPMRELGKWVRAFASASQNAQATPAPNADAPPSTDTTATLCAGSNADAGADQGADDDPFVRWSVHVSRSGRRMWRAAAEYASRSAGSPLSPGQALELVIAEASSGTPCRPRPNDAHSNDAAGGEPQRYLPPPEFHERRLRERIREREVRGRRGLLAFLAEYGEAEGFAWLDPASRDPGPARALDALLEGLRWTDAFEIERRLQQLRVLDQRLEAQMAALLRIGIDRRLLHGLGFATVALYAEARLGMSARRVWSLVAIERASWRKSRRLHTAWRDGHLTLLQATALLPVFDERHGDAWIARAREVTLRRLLDEVAWALDHEDEDGAASVASSCPPPPSDAEVRADATADITDEEVQKRAHGRDLPPGYGAPGAVRLDFALPLSVAVLLESTLDLLQTPREARWQTFERMVALALLQWRGQPRHRDPVFERDGWRCAVPGCSSRRNLHDHHVVFRSRGGGHARDNRITLCAAHHLHGVHAGVVRVDGRAPDGLRWELGCTTGRPPLMRLLGDRIVPSPSSV
jgi:hypothetical protein